MHVFIGSTPSSAAPRSGTMANRRISAGLLVLFGSSSPNSHDILVGVFASAFAAPRHTLKLTGVPPSAAALAHS
jgi:hypothetical protein